MIQEEVSENPAMKIIPKIIIDARYVRERPSGIGRYVQEVDRKSVV